MKLCISNTCISPFCQTSTPKRGRQKKSLPDGELDHGSRDSTPQSAIVATNSATKRGRPRKSEAMKSRESTPHSETSSAQSGSVKSRESKTKTPRSTKKVNYFKINY